MKHVKMKLKVVMLGTALFAINAVQQVNAAPASMIVWDSATRDYIKQADPAAGEKIGQTCISCHSIDGTALLDGFPSLSGQRAEYIFKQLMDYKQGKRVGLGIMPNFAANLEKTDMANVAAWFSQQDLPQKGDVKASQKTQKIVYQGDSARFVPACSACHGLNGEGSIVDVPALAGMSMSYFKTTMLRLKNNERHNDIYKRMRLVAQKLSEQEIDDLAKYYSSIGLE